MRRSELLAVALACLLLALAACPAQAEAAPETVRRASEAFERGRALFEQGYYRDALEVFEQANGLVPSYVLEYNIGRCLEEEGRAAAALARFEVVAAHAKDPALAARAQAKVDAARALRSHTGIHFLGLTLDQQVMVNSVVLRPDATGFVRLEVGHHLVIVSRRHFKPWRARVHIIAGQTLVLAPRLEPDPAFGRVDETAARAPVAGTPGLFARHWPTFTCLGVGVAALGAGVASSIMAEDAWDQVRDAEREPDGVVTGLSEREAWRLSDEADRWQVGAIVGYSLFGAALTGALLTYVLAPEPGADRAALGFGLVPLPGGAAFSLRVSP
jgi:tetratricopeptide (TPR) repeat protein